MNRQTVSVVSIVVPTYNRRGEGLGAVLNRLLASNRQGLDEIEIVVVDDGSPIPAAPIVTARKVPTGFTLRCVRQENTGPAAARNQGFAACSGDIVIFIDDDILVPPDLVRQHVEAHALNPNALIFGGCVPPPGAVHTYVGTLLKCLYGSQPGRPRFERVSIIASGQLSVERTSFPEGVYASQLRTPAAEEFELSARLGQRGMQAIYATQVEAIHDQSFEISNVCKQQYKHAMGCAEAVCKLPSVLILDELAKVAAANGPAGPHDPLATKCKKLVKSLVAISPVRRSLVLLCELAGWFAPSNRISDKLLLFAVGVFFLAGYREGLRRFGPNRL